MLAAVVLLAGCGGHDKPAAPQEGSTEATTSTAPVGSSTTASTVSPATTAGAAPTVTTATTRATTTSATAVGTTITVSEGDLGRTITAHPGDVIAVVLHSTYWSFTTPTSAVLRPEGAASVVPDMHGCVPGGGCGTARIRYRAVAAGSATLTAHRDSCGEALACTGGQGDWHATVHVSG